MKKFLSLLLITSLCSTASAKKHNTIIGLETSYGVIKIELYPETPKHRSNFINLVKSGFYDGILFHRVIAGFMIQTGDPDSKNALPDTELGNGGPGYELPAEIIYPKYFHKRGVVAAARESDAVNPNRASSGSQFYIVQGKTFNDEQLKALELKRKKEAEEKKQLNPQIPSTSPRASTTSDSTTYAYTRIQRNTYKTDGGSPHLDGKYTIFGEVTEGMKVVDSIASTKTNLANRPQNDIKIIRAWIIRK